MTSTQDPFALGAMYWPDPHATRETLVADMRRIRAHHFSVIRSFISWEHLEENRGAFDFTLYDNLYDAAREAGIRIAQTLGVYPPFWMSDELRRKNLFTTDRYQCLDIPDFYKPCARFIRAVVRRYQDHPAQFMWFVWNEPVKRPCTCPHTGKKFGRWLREKYGSIKDLRAEWGRENHVFNSTLAPASFDTLDLPLLAATLFSEKRNYPWILDWLAFAQDNLAENIRWIADEIRAIDKVHPTHANPNQLLYNGTWSGAHPWKIAASVDSVGASVHPCHFYERALTTTDPLIFDPHASYAYMNDLMRSAAGGKDFWVSELQAGPNINSGHRPFSPTAANIKAWIWQAVGKGSSGLLFWLWQAWRSSWECGEFSLVDGVDGSDTDRSRAASAAGAILDKHRDLVTAAKPVPARVALLYSPESQSLAFREEKSEWTTRAMVGCYTALWRHNIAVDFVTPDDIASGALDPARYKVLYAPYAKLVTAETGAHIARYVHEGGALWADGHFAYRGAHSHLHDTNPGAGLAAVLGCKESNLLVEKDFFSFSQTSPRRRKIQGWLFGQCLTPVSPDARIRARYADGHAAAISGLYGKGRTFMVGTYLCIGYQRKPDPGAESLIVDFARECGVAPRAVVQGDPLEVNVLSADTHDLLVVTNHAARSATARITVNPAIRYQELINLETGKTLSSPKGPSKNAVISVRPDAHDTLVLLARKV
ncbi:beta-galactosidase [Opitutaceae bacterium TAV5]|nr:beta-galactosidase [Opitutaceae bacterium TAV5]